VITFYVVKEPHGWAIRMGEGMTTPFWSKHMAVQAANSLARAIRCHGERTQVIIQDLNEVRASVPLAVSLGLGTLRRLEGVVVS
jgi:hypothetical protein